MVEVLVLAPVPGVTRWPAFVELLARGRRAIIVSRAYPRPVVGTDRADVLRQCYAAWFADTSRPEVRT